MERWQALVPGGFDAEPYQSASRRPSKFTDQELAASVHLETPDGRWHSAARAVFELRALAPGHGLSLALYKLLPPFARASEAAYRVIASRRVPAARVSRLFFGADPEPPRSELSRRVFTRGTALAALVAFVSFWVQADGLVGARGIEPAAEFLKAVHGQLGAAAYGVLPTLGWLSAGDGAIHALCAAGAGVSLLALAGVFVAPCLWLAWALYLSVCVLGQDFLGFQWDILLVEMLFLGALWAPAAPRSRFAADTRSSRAMEWLARWLLFRLMFESGLVKLASRDPAWRGLTALLYHYQTQPLPTWIGYYAHQLPVGAQLASCAVMFVIESVLPFAAFLPRRPRAAAFAGLLLLQVLIALTGNYCFFNFLAVLLCFTLLDDAVVRRCLPRSWRARLAEPASRPETPRWLAKPRLAVAALVAVLGAVPLWRLLGARVPPPLASLYALSQPWRTVNGYGLFAVMTTSRYEIAVQGSADGKEWKDYEFKYKPGDVTRRPAFVEPHQPRLDWQMWFAALSEYRQNPWFMQFLVRLMEGSPPVLALLEKNPFPGAPPAQVRAVVYEYRFSTLEEKRRAGAWWTREFRGLYCPVIVRDR